MQGIVRVNYKLNNNRADYLKTFQTCWTILKSNSDKIYNITITIK